MSEKRLRVTRGADFRLPFRVRPRGATVDTSSATIQIIVSGGPTWTNSDKISALAADSQSATAITGAFTASGIVTAAGAQFATNRVSIHDTATIAGSTSNDGTYPVVSLTSDTVIVLDATFTPEAGTGTVTVSRGAEWWELHLEEADTSALSLGSRDYYCSFLLGDTFFPFRGLLEVVDP